MNFLRGPAIFAATLLLIEFLDEFVFGAREAAWPLIRAELDLSYDQVGILLSVPGLLASIIELFFGVLGDTHRRRLLILGGGIVFASSLLLMSSSLSFWALLASFILFYPASGAFVSLSQAALMDTDAGRHEQNMARWTLAGSVGIVAGPLALGLASANDHSWRAVALVQAAMALILVAVAWRFRFPVPSDGSDEAAALVRSTVRGLAGAFGALRPREILRWLTLGQFSDLMLDVLHGYLALYFVDVVGGNTLQAGVAVAVWTGVGLLGDALLLPLLERVSGMRYLRFSVFIELALYPAFLLAPGLLPKLALLGLMGFFNAGWYSILQAQLYRAMPNQSGTVLALSNIAGFAGSLFPLLIGVAATAVGLETAMWLLVLGPVALLIGLPRRG